MWWWNISISLTIDDHCRVILEVRPGDEGSDYINASFINVGCNIDIAIYNMCPQGYHQKAAYIVTQSPLQNTCGDFWRMIWEKKIASIVMLTKLTENETVRVNQLHHQCMTLYSGKIDYYGVDFIGICQPGVKI